jgi:hypothetical protein
MVLIADHDADLPKHGERATGIDPHRQFGSNQTIIPDDPAWLLFMPLTCFSSHARFEPSQGRGG